MPGVSPAPRAHCHHAPGPAHRVPGHSCPPWPQAPGAALGAVRGQTRASGRWAAVALTEVAPAVTEAPTPLGPECQRPQLVAGQVRRAGKIKQVGREGKQEQGEKEGRGAPGALPSRADSPPESPQTLCGPGPGWTQKYAAQWGRRGCRGGFCPQGPGSPRGAPGRGRGPRPSPHPPPPHPPPRSPSLSLSPAGRRGPGPHSPGPSWRAHRRAPRRAGAR